MCWMRLQVVADLIRPFRQSCCLAGFGSLARHLKRLTHGLSAAMAAGRLSPGDLYALQPYSPVISLTGAMQFTMGTRSGNAYAMAAF